MSGRLKDKAAILTGGKSGSGETTTQVSVRVGTRVMPRGGEVGRWVEADIPRDVAARV